MGPCRLYVRGHVWWLGLKYVTSQMAFCGLYVGILTSPQVHIIHNILLTTLGLGFPYRLGERGLRYTACTHIVLLPMVTFVKRSLNSEIVVNRLYFY